MKLSTLTLLLVATCCAAQTLTGWVSDEQCATSRAKKGIFTGTNPDCAKRCISEGKKNVLVSESKKTVFHVDNPELLKPELGNLIEITGTISGETVHVDSVKQLEVGYAFCARPKKK